MADNNLSILRKWLVPRGYHDTSLTLRHDLKVMLYEHPESFDCLIHPALASSENEDVTLDGPQVGLADRDERGQAFGEPIVARAFIVPAQELAFDSVDSGLFESIVGSTPPVNILLSVPGIRTYSLIQWLEYPRAGDCEPIERTYYIAEVKPMGRTLNAEMIHVCYPLPALGELPELEEEGEEGESVPGDTPDTGDTQIDTDPDSAADNEADASDLFAVGEI